jgi:hypothetical protein
MHPRCNNPSRSVTDNVCYKKKKGPYTLRYDERANEQLSTHWNEMLVFDCFLSADILSFGLRLHRGLLPSRVPIQQQPHRKLEKVLSTQYSYHLSIPTHRTAQTISISQPKPFPLQNSPWHEARNPSPPSIPSIRFCKQQPIIRNCHIELRHRPSHRQRVV